MRRLIFVYNVDASPMALLRDVHQALTTGSTDCRLCDVTFGRVLKNPGWARFVRELPLETEFRMRSTFRRRYPGFDAHRFPAAFLVDDDGPREIISANEIDAVPDLNALRDLVANRLVEVGVLAAGESLAAGTTRSSRRLA